MSMTDKELRLECLRLALGQKLGRSDKTVVAAAIYAEFVMSGKFGKVKNSSTTKD